MKYVPKAVRAGAYVAGIFAISSALLVTVLLFMGAIGFIFPKKEKIVLYTESIEKQYDGTPINETSPTLTYGKLHTDHELVVTSIDSYGDVGVYINEPKYMICDASGADVTDMYDITADLGKITIKGIPLVVYSPSKTKTYDGSPLESDPIKLTHGTLLKDHQFKYVSSTVLSYPGRADISPSYIITDKNGEDVTGLYDIKQELGELILLKRKLIIQSGSAEKTYDGEPLTDDRWAMISGSLLSGHTLNVKNITTASDVGSYDNEMSASVTDSSGMDVSQYYEYSYMCGKLTVHPISIFIKTESAQKEYDGTPLTCEKWSLISGDVCQGEKLILTGASSMNTAGTVENALSFSVSDANGKDITYRYDINVTPGKLTVTPLAITIRTGSATKVYDGKELSCDTYEIIKGSLIDGDRLVVALTSIVNIGYTENYVVEYTIYRDADGSSVDVTGNYRVTYDYGTLTVTAN